METIVSKFLLFQKIPVSKSYVENLILSHPDYPSLLSIADALERLGINYDAWRTTKEELKSIMFPYLLPISYGGGEILFIRNSSDLIKNEGKLNYWEGVVLQTHQTKTITDKSNNKFYSRDKLHSFISFAFFCTALSSLIFPFVLSFSLGIFLLLITALAGIFVGYLLVAKDLGIKYTSVEAFCNTGRNSNCDEILNSEDAKIFGLLKLSDVVLVYFMFQTIMLATSAYIPSLVSSVSHLLLGISFLTIPVIVFSIYYQYSKARSWCKLCLLVNAVLVLQILIFVLVAKSFKLSEINISVAVIAFLIFVFLGLSLLLIKELIDRTNRAENLISKAARIKNSIDVFSYLLFQQRKVDSTFSNQEISIGNPEASIQIMMASNLYCNPCKEQHEKMVELVSSYPEKVNLTIRFLLSGKDINRELTTNQYLIQHWKENITGRITQSNYVEKLLHDWYEIMDLEKFKTKHKIKGQIDDDTKRIEHLHLEWIESARITHTPTFFINGYELPKNYSTEDLIALVPALSEYFSRIEGKSNILESLSI